MYLRLAERRGWKSESLEEQRAAGGLRLWVLRFSGIGIGALAGEGGAHRVKHPHADHKGERRHTSIVTVAVLPIEAAVAELDLAEVHFAAYRASAPGGQHMQKTESAIRATHRPTGISAAIEDERSQASNKARALELLAARVAAFRREQQADTRGQLRRSEIGSGHLATRRRTFDWKEAQVIDHVSGVIAPLAEVLAGGLESFLVDSGAVSRRLTS
jgi:peptide chain release factor 1